MWLPLLLLLKKGARAALRHGLLRCPSLRFFSSLALVTSPQLEALFSRALAMRSCVEVLPNWWDRERGALWGDLELPVSTETKRIWVIRGGENDESREGCGH